MGFIANLDALINKYTSHNKKTVQEQNRNFKSNWLQRTTARDDIGI